MLKHLVKTKCFNIVTLASSHSTLPDDGDHTETFLSCCNFNVNFNQCLNTVTLASSHSTLPVSLASSHSTLPVTLASSHSTLPVTLASSRSTLPVTLANSHSTLPVSLASSHSTLPDDGDHTVTCCSYCNFNVNFNASKKILLCISW